MKRKVRPLECGDPLVYQTIFDETRPNFKQQRYKGTGSKYRLFLNVVQVIWHSIDDLALDLVGPATVVPQTACGHADIDLSHRDSLAVVQRFNGSQLISVRFNELRELHEPLAALLRCDLMSPRALKGLARGLDSKVDVLFGGFMQAADDALIGRVDGLEGLAIYTFDPFVVDEPEDQGQFTLSSTSRRNWGCLQASGLLMFAKVGCVNSYGGHFAGIKLDGTGRTMVDGRRKTPTQSGIGVQIRVRGKVLAVAMTKEIYLSGALVRSNSCGGGGVNKSLSNTPRQNVSSELPRNEPLPILT